MTTPQYTEVTSSLDEIRLYTEHDAYYYTVDNRPLTDLLQNIQELSVAVEAARKAILLEALGNVTQQVWLTGSVASISGLKVISSTTGVAEIGPGILTASLPISTSDSTVVTKRAVLPIAKYVSTPMPYNSGMERKHLIQARYVDFGSGELLPYEDAANPYLLQTMLNGKVELGVLSTAEVAVGTGVTPTVTEGWTPLYAVTCVYGESSMTIEDAIVLPRSDSFYSGSNLLGTVSQVGGVPTGAVIQRGSNANGAFVRFADGTQICTHSMSVFDIDNADGAIFSSDPHTWTYPMPFITTPVINANQVNFSGTWCGTGVINSTSTQIHSYRASTFTGAYTIQMSAIGTWY